MGNFSNKISITNKEIDSGIENYDFSIIDYMKMNSTQLVLDRHLLYAAILRSDVETVKKLINCDYDSRFGERLLVEAAYGKNFEICKIVFDHLHHIIYEGLMSDIVTIGDSPFIPFCLERCKTEIESYMFDFIVSVSRNNHEESVLFVFGMESFDADKFVAYFKEFFKAKDFPFSNDAHLPLVIDGFKLVADRFLSECKKRNIIIDTINEYPFLHNIHRNSHNGTGYPLINKLNKLN